VRFWDASAVVALVIHESTTKTVKELFGADSAIIAWWGTPVECESAVARLVREKTLSTPAAAQARSRLESLAAGWSEIEPTERIREAARRLVNLHPLRAADAFQLAAALLASERNPAPLPFVSLDERLADAARREGFPVLGAVA
jgi:predicted nucleic acid-binding protein